VEVAVVERAEPLLVGPALGVDAGDVRVDELELNEEKGREEERERRGREREKGRERVRKEEETAKEKTDRKKKVLSP